MAISTKKLQDLKDLFSTLGHISFRNYFSYIGIFKDNTMFALYDQKNEAIYIRKSIKYYPEISQTIPVHFLVDRRIGSQQSRIFYHLPQIIIDTIDTYLHWIQSAIEEYQVTKTKLEDQNKNKIRLLPNMNINIERLLSRIEIYTVDDLNSVGIINVFVKLISQGVEVGELLLFKLYGAIKHKYVYMISEQEKRTLLLEADSALYSAGLRKRFTI
ncbi:TfoX/Sxy family DNA transformation protein [Actinobacillus arthritidis]|uniref:TfoX/Sxy family DNA transformation protein n=1 Tax=Actinobacillus arthritidis TaxID=157339 RepID=UPI0024412913|nr:TfoX/Sxy family DNA transformation protein [Actinobacillus arthritidis]WGE89064.1 TfoX/Sxy family DNA transformation protein [Actinobacillus arthritidis]